MWQAPRVPYADGWRFLAHFLSAPFPSDILAPDNGHHEVLPNLVRVIELHAFSADQWLQVLVGIALALATLWVAWRGLRTMPDRSARAAAMLVAVLGIFWLGNIRTLAHANESVHAYLVTLFLVLGILALARHAPHRLRSACIAAACGLAAAFSFGSGIACFVAFMAVLLVRRAGWREWAVIAVGLLLALLLLSTNGGTGPSLHLSLLSQIGSFARWLAGPFVYAGWPALDPAVAAQIPVRGMRELMLALASADQAVFGPVMLARWPHVAFGLGGLVLLAVQSIRARRRPETATLLGIGIAWFAMAVGIMIALVRVDYFQLHPEQLLAPRYVVWSSLFWAGLGLSGVAMARHPRRAGTAAVVVALLLLPSQAWMGALGARMVHVADRAAVAAAAGVVEPSLMLGETDPADLVAALPRLRAARVAMFDWPETRWIGRRPSPDRLVGVDASGLQVVDVGNRVGADGRRIGFTVDGIAAPRLLLIDEDGVARGLALRDGGPTHWIGWMQNTSEHHPPPHVAALRSR